MHDMNEINLKAKKVGRIVATKNYSNIRAGAYLMKDLNEELENETRGS